MINKDKNEILSFLQNRTDPFPSADTIQSEGHFIRYFEMQADNNPEKIAVEDGTEKITYRQLNQSANQFARYLQSMHLDESSVVVVALERSILFIKTILAIWKCGAAYLPVKPEEMFHARLSTYYKPPINYIIYDICNHGRGAANYQIKEINLQDIQPEIDCQSKENLALQYHPEQLAYIIFTSGSTGEPKGVMIEHKSMMNHLLNKVCDLNLDNFARISQNSSQCFDISIWQMFAAFLVGGTTIIYSDEVAKDPYLFTKKIYKDKVNILEIVPTYLAAILNDCNRNLHENFCKLHFLLVTGEKLSYELAKKWLLLHRNIPLVNAYGPTECADDVTHCILSKLSELNNVPIGKPLKNIEIRIVNDNGDGCKNNEVGEIIIYGISVGRGYLNIRSQDQTAFFCENLNGREQRAYKTGDYGKWMPNGEIEYIGRRDSQIKLHGYRIELGEIENALRKNDKIEDAVVLFKGNEICAYVKLYMDSDINEIKTDLYNRLPVYMHPTHYVSMKQFPLTENGKIDKKKLPEPVTVLSSNSQIKAETDTQILMLKIWRNTFRYENIDIHSNFFELGGDSIKAIQIAGELYNCGYQVAIKDIMERETIYKLSNFVMKKAEDEQESVSGNVPLTPIQNMFFKMPIINHNHWNQSVRLYGRRKLDEKNLETAIRKVVVHHDALRMCFKNQKGWICSEDEISSSLIVRCTNFSNREETFRQVQRSLNVEEIPLFKVLLCHTLDGDYVDLIAHHLIVDAVSWRIIIEDIEIAYMQQEMNVPIKFNKKTSSYQKWAYQLEEYASSAQFACDKAYWEKLMTRHPTFLTPDKEIGNRKQKNVRVEVFRLDASDTKRLLTKAAAVESWEINDILLSAIGKTIGEWQHLDELYLKLESHGREQISNDLNVTRTVGLFTSEFPIYLQGRSDDRWRDRILKCVKYRKEVPNNGIGYAICKYFLNMEFENMSEPDIAFNYLGEMDPASNNTLFDYLQYMDTEDFGEENERSCAIEIECMVIDKQFELRLMYDYLEYNNKNIKDLCEMLKENLIAIINYCVNVYDATTASNSVSVSDNLQNEIEAMISNLNI